jgi:hypothetical protein
MKKQITFGLVILLGGVGCATSSQRSTTLTTKLSQQTHTAQNSVNQALDAKDQIHQLLKEDQFYDNKEINLLKHLD